MVHQSSRERKRKSSSRPRHSLLGGPRRASPSLSQAYFWIVLARAAGDKNSKTFAEILASRMTRAQAVAIEQKAEIWYEQHESQAKPAPGR